MINKLLKSRIFFLCLGLLIAGSIGVYAVNVASSDVTYDNTNSESEATTVKEAIDDLYEQIGSSNVRVEEIQTLYSWSGSTITRTMVLPEGVDFNNFILYECGHGVGTYELFVNNISTPVLTTLSGNNPTRTYDAATRTFTIRTTGHGSANATSYYKSYIAY